MYKPMRFDQPLRWRSVSGSLPVLTGVAYVMTALTCLAVLAGTIPTWVQAEPAAITSGLAQQLRAVMAEKKSRTAAQQKIDTFLLMAVKQQRGEAIPFAAHGVEVAADDTVVVEIQCPVTGNFADAIEAMGGTVLSSHPRYDLVRARMPLSQLETLASKPVVRSVRLPVPMVTRQGTSTTEGDRAHRVAEVRSTFGFDGSGITICVISNGVDNLAARQAAGELPLDVQILTAQEGQGTEGTAMLEIIFDLVSGASLGFATALDSPEQFATNIRDLANVIGCDIIVDDVGYLNQSPFQSGPISRAVEEVVDSGVVYLSATGNDGSQAKGTSGTYEGEYVDSGVDFQAFFPSLPIFGSLHGFPTDNGPNVTNELMTMGSGVALHWTDPLAGSNNDYDLCLADETLSMLFGCSSAIQNGDDDPFEFIPFAPARSQAVIINFDDAAMRRFLHLQAFGSILEEGTHGAIFGHPGTDAAIAVGAVNVNQTSADGVFGPENRVEVEDFSSDGPRRVFFDADGKPFTPGNFTSTGGIVRQKPDITAADGVTTTTPGFESFFGTSASAPHAAGVAALLLQADPTLTPAQIKTILGITALDIEQTGPDQVSGFGVIDAFNAVDALNDGVEQIINEALILDHLDMTYDPHDRRALAGVLVIEATFANVSSESFRDIFFQVRTLTGGHQVLNADGHSGGAGSQIRGPDRLDAGDTFDVVFEIGLQEATPFYFFVDVFGTPN